MHNILKNAVARVMCLAPEREVFRTGSRVIGAHTEESDYDIVVRIPDFQEPLPLRLLQLGELTPLTREQANAYGEAVTKESNTIFYLKIKGLPQRVNVLFKRDIQFRAWRYATNSLIGRGVGNPQFLEREYRVAQFKTWRQSYAAGYFAHYHAEMLTAYLDNKHG